MNVTETMYSANSLKQGVQCGAKEDVSGAYRSGNPATKLETALDGAWKNPRYWEGNAASKTIGKIKKELEAALREARSEKYYLVITFDPESFHRGETAKV